MGLKSRFDIIPLSLHPLFNIPLLFFLPPILVSSNPTKILLSITPFHPSFYAILLLSLLECFFPLNPSHELYRTGMKTSLFFTISMSVWRNSLKWAYGKSHRVVRRNGKDEVLLSQQGGGQLENNVLTLLLYNPPVTPCMYWTVDMAIDAIIRNRKLRLIHTYIQVLQKILIILRLFKIFLHTLLLLVFRTF